MKPGMLAGIALTFSSVFGTPVQAAQDCQQVVQQMTTLSATIGQDAQSYWEARKAFIASKTERPKKGVPAANKAVREAASLSQSARAKASMPTLLRNFAALSERAKSQKCLPPEKLRELREASFNNARRVNFDEVPKTPTTEGLPAENKPPRMPQR